MNAFAGVVRTERLEVELDVRSGRVGGGGAGGVSASVRKYHHLTRRHAQRAGSVQQVFQPHQHLPQGMINLVVQSPLAAFVDRPNLQVVLKILADAGQIPNHRNLKPPAQPTVADAGKLQDLRRADGAGAQHRLARRRLPCRPARGGDTRPRSRGLRRRAAGSHGRRF